jgi:hypothetical protein
MEFGTVEKEERQEKNKHLKKWGIGKAAQWLVDHAKETGIDIAGFEHKITDFFKNHVLREHGNSEKEKARGQIAINEDDFEKISGIVENPDHAMIGAKREGKDVLYYVKKMNDGTILYVENIINNKNHKELLGKTMFKREKNVSKEKFKNIVSMNNRADISKARIVNPVGTGGDPSYAKVVANPTQPSGQLSVSNIPQNLLDVKDKKE